MPKHTWGVLVPKQTDEVPGSIKLIADSPLQEPLGVTEDNIGIIQPVLKRTDDGKIILSPQPDDDPDDPLNWAQWRRDIALLVLGWHCLVGGGQTPILAAGFNDVARDFGVSVPDVALTTGLYMMGMGVGSVIVSPTALLYGKRPVYLAGTLLFLVSSIWAAVSNNFASMVASRIIMGIGVAPCEALPSATIAEIFFLHERAYRIGIYTLLLLGGKNLVPLASAVVIQAKGWRWVFWVVAIIVGVNLALLYLFVPETFWDRTPRPSAVKKASKATMQVVEGQIPEKVKAEEEDDEEKIDEKAGLEGRSESSTSSATLSSPPPKSTSPSSEKPPLPTSDSNTTTASAPSPTQKSPKPFTAGLQIYHGRLTQDSWLRSALRPFTLFAYPAILWSALVYSLGVGWLIVLSEAMAHIYQHHPYNFNSLQTGLVYLSPFVGGILGTAVAGKLSDVIVRFMAKRNGGVYEPEFRLLMGIPIALTTAAGLMGFGWSAEEGVSYWVPTIMFGLISFGCTLGSTTAITFAVDSYRQFAGEALVTLNFSKNVLHGMVFSLFFNSWLEDKGSKSVFVILGVVHVACLLATIPLYIYGKRLRLWTVGKNFAGKL